jgi:hypothetical protein
MLKFQLCFIFVLSSHMAVSDVVVALPSTAPIVCPVSSLDHSPSSSTSSLPSFFPSSQPSLAPTGILVRHSKTRILLPITENNEVPTQVEEADRQVNKRKRRKMKIEKYIKRTGGKSSLRYKKSKGDGKLSATNGKSLKRTDDEGRVIRTIVVSVSRNSSQAMLQ